MFVDRRTVFVHVPKTGGSNLRENRRTHLTLEEVARISPNVLACCEVVAIYRDPVERFQSLTNYYISGGNKRTSGLFPDQMMLEFVKRLVTLDDKSFRNLLTHLIDSNRMFWRQSRFLMINGRFAATTYVSLGSNYAQTILGAKQANKSVCKTYISDNKLKIVAELYEEDYDLQAYLSE